MSLVLFIHPFFSPALICFNLCFWTGSLGAIVFLKTGDEYFLFLLWSSGSTGSDFWDSFCSTFSASAFAVDLWVPVISSYEPCLLPFFLFWSSTVGQTVHLVGYEVLGSPLLCFCYHFPFVLHFFDVQTSCDIASCFLLWLFFGYCLAWSWILFYRSRLGLVVRRMVALCA